jgi:hypothetical protein
MVRAVWKFLLILSSSIVETQQPAPLALVNGNQGYSAKVDPLKNPHNDVHLIFDYDHVRPTCAHS